MRALFIIALWLFGCGSDFSGSLPSDAGASMDALGKPAPIVCPSSPYYLPRQCKDLYAVCTWPTPQYLDPNNPNAAPPVQNCECAADGGWNCW